MKRLLMITGLAALFGGLWAYAQYTPMSAEDAVFPITLDVNEITVDAGSGIDTASAGALDVGAATATSVLIGAADITTTNLGPAVVSSNLTVGLDLTVSGGDIDSGAGAMTVGAAAATSLALGASDILTTVSGPLGYVVNFSLDSATGIVCTADSVAATGVYGNYHFNNDADAIDYILPAVVAGMNVTIGNSDLGGTNVITIDVNASDKIVLDGVLLSAGDSIDSPLEVGGAQVTLVGVDGVRWVVKDKIGTWIDGN